MEISLFLAQFWGCFLVILCLIFLLKGKVFLEELFKLTRDRGFLFLAGCLNLILGLITLILHNIWVADWRVVITILGWLCLIVGVLRISFPEFIQKSVSVYEDKLILPIRVGMIIVGLLGAWLIWMSF